MAPLGLATRRPPPGICSSGRSGKAQGLGAPGGGQRFQSLVSPVHKPGSLGAKDADPPPRAHTSRSPLLVQVPMRRPSGTIPAAPQKAPNCNRFPPPTSQWQDTARARTAQAQERERRRKKVCPKFQCIFPPPARSRLGSDPAAAVPRCFQAAVGWPVWLWKNTFQEIPFGEPRFTQAHQFEPPGPFSEKLRRGGGKSFLSTLKRRAKHPNRSAGEDKPLSRWGRK